MRADGEIPIRIVPIRVCCSSWFFLFLTLVEVLLGSDVVVLTTITIQFLRESRSRELTV